MGWTIKWKREPKLTGKNQLPTGDYVYKSTDGRFIIIQSKFPSHSLYVLSDSDDPNLRRLETHHEALNAAKYWAELLKDPNYDG